MGAFEETAAMSSMAKDELDHIKRQLWGSCYPRRGKPSRRELTLLDNAELHDGACACWACVHRACQRARWFAAGWMAREHAKEAKERTTGHASPSACRPVRSARLAGHEAGGVETRPDQAV